MKKIIMIGMAALVALSLQACRKMLDIKPNDRLLEDAVFGERNGVYGVLNGIYTSMAAADSYGQGFTMTVPDLLAQYYSSYQSSYNSLVQGNYVGSDVHLLTDSLWSSSYNLVLQTNILMGHVKRDQGNGLTESDRNILLGETHAIRAFLHFDLLRLFGPVYSIDSNAISIPYNTGEIQQIYKILPAVDVMRQIQSDLDSAASYLANDPVITNGITNTFDIVVGNNFMQRRNLRLNYYAVRALQARVALYRGDKASAQVFAQEVITKTDTIFTWAPSDASLPGSVNQDLTFSSEIIFGLFNSGLYNSYRSLFSPSNATVLKPDENGLLSFYEKNINDFRYRGWWRQDPNGVQKSRTFYRYVEPTTNAANPNPIQLYMQPLIRLSEVYYIAAETAPDPVTAVDLLNTVRLHRGLSSLDANTDLNKEIANEYRKDFWGEGQLFYYYKRKNALTIPTTAGTGTTISFISSRYVIPLPLSESLNR
ncbi:SusD family protein [Chitinophaga costaii]|uniref:SusD family protein n=1 Tax=Chitinophaga costaii TaxID=1335309 RepID=A0A1C4BJW0_9BACT|nr:RagB/SusD family nutrient uptake outer membrane protein [Chitinophaga costaii]PUZ27576.1 RagB/SusD family nutrient uptake outer membrane protein [Chitinophaga costaii]SCC07189.1 SusD family protein [Chitinophaga costaii]